MDGYLPTPPAEGAVRASEATVFLPTPLHPRSEVYAAKRFKKLVRPNQDGLTQKDCLAECDGILLRIGSVSADDMAVATRVRMIARNGTGCDSIDLAEAKRRGIVVTNVPGGNAKDVAELCLTLMLCVLRRVVEVHNRITSGERVPSITALSPGLFGKTIGLIGMGDTAYELCRLLAPFGCTILVYSPTSPQSRWAVAEQRYPAPIAHRRVNTLDELLQSVDVVSIHCPLTPQTRNMIAERELALMRDEAVLINAARGGIVDETALARALKSGKLGGAGLDVMETEPAFGENLGELRYLPNVVILPHLGGSVDRGTEIGCNIAIDSLADHLDGKLVRNRVV